LLLVVGKTTDPHFISSIEQYLARVKHYIPFEIQVIPELKNTQKLSRQEQKNREGTLILRSLEPGDKVVLLDEKGTERRSVDFAQWLQQQMSAAPRRLVFVIGGPYGFSDAVYSSAPERISLSRMTFSHQMIRLIFVEQFYRALTILRGESYHHE
jgi:23S rRNA (pseudouridine1915-N3)-methyltransferase